MMKVANSTSIVTPGTAGAYLPNAARTAPSPQRSSGPIALKSTASWPTGPTPTLKNEAEIAYKFETLIAETLLRSARAANLGEDGLGQSGGHVRDMVDHHRAEAIARAAPLGVARLLAGTRP